MRAYAEATDDAQGGPVFAIGSHLEDHRACIAVGRVGQHQALRRPLRGGRNPAPAHHCQDDSSSPVQRRSRSSRARTGRRSSSRRTRAARTAIRERKQYVTEFFRGVATESAIGERAPDHRLEVDGDPLAEVTYSIADDQTVRYAAASGDDFAIHLDDAFAQQVGLPGRIVHGLCTMAFAGRAVLEAAGIDDPKYGEADRGPLLGAISRRIDPRLAPSTARSGSSP